MGKEVHNAAPLSSFDTRSIKEFYIVVNIVQIYMHTSERELYAYLSEFLFADSAPKICNIIRVSIH